MFTDSPDLLLLMIFAGFIFYKLYSVFGQHSDVDISSNINLNNNFNLNKIKEVKNPQEIDTEINLLTLNDNIRETLKSIKEIDSAFSYNKFMRNAEKAFELIVDAYTKNDKDFLKNMLTQEIFESFSINIDNNKKNNKYLFTTIVKINNCQIIDASLENYLAKLTIKFDSEQINLIKNSENNIVEGDPAQINNVEDIWTFKRSLKSTDPTWLLCKTA